MSKVARFIISVALLLVSHVAKGQVDMPRIVFYSDLLPQDSVRVSCSIYSLSDRLGNGGIRDFTVYGHKDGKGSSSRGKFPVSFTKEEKNEFMMCFFPSAYHRFMSYVESASLNVIDYGWTFSFWVYPCSDFAIGGDSSDNYFIKDKIVDKKYARKIKFRLAK